MAKRASHKDQYKSTGWCKALGRVSSAAVGMTAATSAVATRRANAAARTMRMDAIIDRYVGQSLSINEGMSR